MTILAFETNYTTVDDVQRGIDRCPFFSEFRPLWIHMTKTIHGVLDLDKRIARDRLELYCGRSNNAKSVLGRAKSHESNPNRNHEYFVVAAEVPTSKVERFELLAVKLLRRLHKEKCLCVSNVAIWPAGSLPSSNISTLYLTFSWKERSEVKRATPAQLDLIAKKVSTNFVGVSKNSLRETLTVVRQWASSKTVKWGNR